MTLTSCAYFNYIAKKFRDKWSYRLFYDCGISHICEQRYSSNLHHEDHWFRTEKRLFMSSISSDRLCLKYSLTFYPLWITIYDMKIEFSYEQEHFYHCLWREEQRYNWEHIGLMSSPFCYLYDNCQLMIVFSICHPLYMVPYILLI